MQIKGQDSTVTLFMLRRFSFFAVILVSLLCPSAKAALDCKSSFPYSLSKLSQQPSIYTARMMVPSPASNNTSNQVNTYIDQFRRRIEPRMQSAASEYSTSLYLTSKGDLNDPWLRSLVDDVTACFGLNRSFAEPFAVTRYTHGQQYNWHRDTYDAVNALRVGTAILYLNTIEWGGGGETIFAFADPLNHTCYSKVPLKTLKLRQNLNEACKKPQQFLTIKPSKGTWLFFRNVLLDKPESEDWQTIHAGCPVSRKHDEKWLLQLWIRAKPYHFWDNEAAAK